MNKRLLKILIISYDWSDSVSKNPQGVITKLKRDHLYSEQNQFLLVSWSRQAGTIRISDRVQAVHLKGRFPKLRPLYDLLMVVTLPFVLKKHAFRPHIAIAYDFPLILSILCLKVFLGSKIIMMLTNLPKELVKTKKYHTLATLYYSMAQYMGIRCIDQVGVINESTKKYALNAGIKEESIFLFSPNTIVQDAGHIEKAQKGLVRTKLGLRSGEKIILSVGRLEPEKNFEILIHLFAKLTIKDLKLVIVGEGILRPNLERLVSEYNIAQSVIFAGHISRDYIWNYYLDADVFVLLSRSEALGLVFWEAMYMRIPVIGSRVDGIAETIGKDGERGFLWEDKDGVEEFGKKLSLCLNPVSVTDMLERAKNYVDAKIHDPSILKEQV